MSFTSSQRKILTYTFTSNILGRGSYSKVYLGYTFNNEKCAIKVISSIGLNISIKDKLVDEANILKKLNHPNIIKLYDIYEEFGDIYIIMEYCETTMSSLLNMDLSEKYVKYYIKQLVDGLYYLQKKNIVHRDIKPANILLKNNVIKISDFGFARSIDSNETMMDTICGSPLYMAPEILYKAKYSSKSDLWSLGIIIYQMIYREHPYKNPRSIIDLIKKIEGDEIDFPNKINNVEISEECINLMKELLEVVPTKRMTLNELRNDLWFIDLPISDTINNLEIKIDIKNDDSNEDIFNIDYTNNEKYISDADSFDINMSNDVFIDNYLENINIKTKPIDISPKKVMLKSNIKLKLNDNSPKNSPKNSIDKNNVSTYMSNSIGSSFLGLFGIKK